MEKVAAPSACASRRPDELNRPRALPKATSGPLRNPRGSSSEPKPTRTACMHACMQKLQFEKVAKSQRVRHHPVLEGRIQPSQREAAGGAPKEDSRPRTPVSLLARQLTRKQTSKSWSCHASRIVLSMMLLGCLKVAGCCECCPKFEHNSGKLYEC